MSERLAKLKHLMDIRSQQQAIYRAFILPHLMLFIACLAIPLVAWWQMQTKIAAGEE